MPTVEIDGRPTLVRYIVWWSTPKNGRHLFAQDTMVGNARAFGALATCFETDVIEEAIAVALADDESEAPCGIGEVWMDRGVRQWHKLNELPREL